MRSPRGSVWLGVLGPNADDWIPEAVDDVAVARLLTHREAMDFRWALEALRQAGEERRGRPRATGASGGGPSQYGPSPSRPSW